MSYSTTNTQILNLTNKNSSSGKNNILRYNLRLPLELKDYQVALSFLQLYYSWFNISTLYNNNSLSYIWNDFNIFSVNLPNSMMTIEDISGFIQQTLFNNGHYLLDDTGSPVYYISLVSNTVYYRVSLVCNKIPGVLPTGWSNPNGILLSGTTPRLVIPSTGIRTTLGFDAGTYPDNPQSSDFSINGQNTPFISNVIAVNVNCNLVQSSLFNSSLQTIYTFSPNSGFGTLLNLEPKNLLFYDCITGSFPYIELVLTDQDNSELNIQDPTMAVSLIFRKK